MDAKKDVLVKVGETLSDREHLLSLVVEDQQENASQSLEWSSFGTPAGSRRAYLLLLVVILAFVGTNYAFRVTREVPIPRRVVGVLFSGTCRPSGEIRVSAEGLGTVSEIPVKPGDVVEKGQLLMRMDEQDAIAALDAAELQRSIAQENLLSLRTRFSVAKARAALSQEQQQALPARQLRDSPERAQAAYDQVRRSYDRIVALVQLGVVPEQDLDNKSAELRIAKDDLEIAQELAKASKQVATDQTEEIHAETDLEQQQMLQELRRADLQVTECRRRLKLGEVRAPDRGVVAEVLAHEGDRLSGGVPLVRLAQLHRMIVEVPVAAELISQLHTYQSATVELPTMPVREVDGIVRAINPLPEANMTHLVQVEFINSDLQLFSGQPAKVRFSE